MGKPGYPEECVIAYNAKYEVRVPAYPAKCDYVRILMMGQHGSMLEKFYWDKNEWAEHPDGVMGAVMGAVKAVLANSDLLDVWPLNVGRTQDE